MAVGGEVARVGAAGQTDVAHGVGAQVARVAENVVEGALRGGGRVLGNGCVVSVRRSSARRRVRGGCARRLQSLGLCRQVDRRHAVAVGRLRRLPCSGAAVLTGWLVGSAFVVLEDLVVYVLVDLVVVVLVSAIAAVLVAFDAGVLGGVGGRCASAFGVRSLRVVGSQRKTPRRTGLEKPRRPGK